MNVRKVLITIVGGLVMTVGALLLVTPGPGLLIIAGGLAILSSEYDWAKRLLHKVRSKIREQKERLDRRLKEKKQDHEQD